MNNWIREYEEIETSEYLKLFDRVMRKENDTNVEFLEKSIEEVIGRKAIVCNSGTDALHFSLISLGLGPAIHRNPFSKYFSYQIS